MSVTSSHDLSEGPNILKFSIYEKTLILDILENGLSSHRKGVGTESYRKIMQELFDRGLTSLRTEACCSSHVFHTFMGMIPEERPIISVIQNFGNRGYRVLTQILETSSSQAEEIESILKKNGCLLKEILLFYTNSSASELLEPLTKEEFEDHREIFQEISEKTESFIQTKFLPEIIRKRLLNTSDGQRRSTSNMGSINMIMSAQGIDRWKECINNDTPFTPFKDLSHLSDYMTQEQRLACLG
jgi:hypothetical protein